jgi:hypothetical protein
MFLSAGHINRGMLRQHQNHFHLGAVRYWGDRLAALDLSTHLPPRYVPVFSPFVAGIQNSFSRVIGYMARDPGICPVQGGS